VSQHFDSKAKVWLERAGRFVLSRGRAELLRAVEEKGSIVKAAEKMGMSYRHAWGIIREINKTLGEKVASSARGGKEGGKTTLTKEGRELLAYYETIHSQVEGCIRYGRKPALATDGILVKDGKILLVKRGKGPFKGYHALPGGFVEYGETVEEAVVREVKEETALKTEVVRLLGVYSDPERDPRGHVISVVWELRLLGGKLKAGDDAAEAVWVDGDRLPEMAFDHLEILKNSLKKIK
jgi:8-oxo-dGTP diphosphatase